MCIRDTKWLQEKLISINTLRWTHPGWRESRLSVCEWTADTPVYIPQREKSHLPTRKWADRSSTINWRVRLRRMFLPRGRNTHTHTHTHTHTWTQLPKLREKPESSRNGPSVRVREAKKTKSHFSRFPAELLRHESVWKRPEPAAKRAAGRHVGRKKWHFLSANWRRVSVWL